MGQLVLFNMMSLDGFFEGTTGELDWHNVDGEFNEFASQQLDSADNVVFGRKTYDLMASYWPTDQAISGDPIIAKKMNEIKKMVFSKTLDKTTWENTVLLKKDVAKNVSELKAKSERNVLLLGSANLSETLIENNLIDVYRIMVNPIILGNGIPLFADLKDQIDLTLMNVRTFKSGNVLLEYEPAKSSGDEKPGAGFI